MTKTRILSLLVLVMGLLNVGLLVLLWLGRPDGAAGRPGAARRCLENRHLLGFSGRLDSGRFWPPCAGGLAGKF